MIHLGCWKWFNTISNGLKEKDAHVFPLHLNLIKKDDNHQVAFFCVELVSFLYLYNVMGGLNFKPFFFSFLVIWYSFDITINYKLPKTRDGLVLFWFKWMWKINSNTKWVLIILLIWMCTLLLSQTRIWLNSCDLSTHSLKSQNPCPVLDLSKFNIYIWFHHLLHAYTLTNLPRPSKNRIFL